EAAEVLVDGTIGGKEYRFLLDTGAARTSVILDDYTSTFGSIETSNSAAVFATSSNDLITVPNLKLGPISKQDFTLARMSGGGEDIHVRNLIGMDLLKEVCCHFLFDQSLVLVNPSYEPEAGYSFQELFLDKAFHPYVDIQYGRVKAKAVWDSGAGITVVDMGFIRAHPAFFEEVGQSTGTDATGSRMETPMFIMEATVIGNNRFQPHKVAGVDLSQVNATIEVPMDMILGYSTLSKANWLIDFPRCKWAITKLLNI
ncbi:MAG: retropepsin-like aspartic protease, partial [Chloroflexota bacterium]